MGNSQKPQLQVNAEKAENLGQFLPQIQVQNNPNDDVTVSPPIPPTPCFIDETKLFKKETKIQIQKNEILTKMYEQESKLKQQQQFQILLEKQDQQIQKAKANYQKRVKQNMVKFKQIQDRKEMCKQLYEEQYDSMDENDDKEKQNGKEHTQIIWGQKVCTQFTNPIQQYFTYRYPKEQNLNSTEKYKNWHIYKQKMYKDEMEQLTYHSEKLKNLETNLKNKYQTLLERKQQRINSSTTYAALKEQQSKFRTNMKSPSPKKKKKRQKDSINQSLFSSKKVSQNYSQETTKIDLSQSFKKQNQNDSFQNAGQSASTIMELMGNYQSTNPQHWSPKSPQTDFLAKQIFHYQNYSSKRRSSFVYSREQIERLSMEGNQYPPKRKNHERPVRCQENLINNKTFKSKSKSPKKRAKLKDGQIEYSQQKKQDDDQKSVYQKVYQKIPKRLTKMMYSEAQGKLTEVKDFYPYEGSPDQRQQKELAYPEMIKVNDSVGSKEVMEFKISGKTKIEKLGYGYMESVDTNKFVQQNEVELSPIQKELYKKKRSQRDYEARILKRLKNKKIS